VTLEINIETRAVEEALRRDCKAEKWGLRGWPDRQVLLGEGFHFWWEFKTLTGKLRKAQIIVREKLIALGDTVYVPRSYLEAVEQLEHEIRLHRRRSSVAGVRGW
jgi:hypothetical protein